MSTLDTASAAVAAVTISESEFRELLGAHIASKRPYHQALTITRDGERAAELVQDGAVRALENWQRYDASRPLNAWFFQVMFNRYSLTRYHVRKDEQHLVSIDAPLGDSDEDDVFTRGALLMSDEQLEAGLLGAEEEAQLSERTRRALACMRAPERMAIVARDLRGLDGATAAALLGVSLSMLSFHLSRARQAFKTAYEALGAA